MGLDDGESGLRQLPQQQPQTLGSPEGGQRLTGVEASSWKTCSKSLPPSPLLSLLLLRAAQELGPEGVLHPDV